MPTTRLVSGKLLIYLDQEHHGPLMDIDGQLLTGNPNLCVPRVTDSCEVAVEDDILPSDDDISSSDRETEQNEVASDENIVSGTGSDDD